MNLSDSSSLIAALSSEVAEFDCTTEEICLTAAVSCFNGGRLADRILGYVLIKASAVSVFSTIEASDCAVSLTMRLPSFTALIAVSIRSAVFFSRLGALGRQVLHLFGNHAKPLPTAPPAPPLPRR